MTFFNGYIDQPEIQYQGECRRFVLVKHTPGEDEYLFIRKVQRHSCVMDDCTEFLKVLPISAGAAVRKIKNNSRLDFVGAPSIHMGTNHRVLGMADPQFAIF